MASSESLPRTASLDVDSRDPRARPGPVPATGLTVLVSPPYPAVDIVFVHGFTGHPEKTWTNRRPTGAHEVEDDGESSRSNRLGRRFLSASSTAPRPPSGQAVYWPRDLLPDAVPNARVLTYGYDTHLRSRFMGRTSKSTVSDIAGDLLVTLTLSRQRTLGRPLVFVAHSLGGIVVKECLRLSRSYRMHQQHLEAVFASTLGIIFFGTPDGGSDPRAFLQHVAAMAIKSVGSAANAGVVSALLPSAERLMELRSEFGPMAREQGWVIHSFQEQYGILALGGNKVVEDPLSCLNDPSLEITQHIARNHMQMCRFSGFGDPEYAKFVAALARTLERPSNAALNPTSPMDPTSRRERLETLAFPKMFMRETTIREAHRTTCDWLLESPQFRFWLDNRQRETHHGFFWIMGKPGAGKSTAMKFLVEHTRATFRNTLAVAFYFNARGDELEKSVLGMYRSLLYQILTKEPRLAQVLDALGPLPFQDDDLATWELAALESLFRATISRLGPLHLVCFIDALDECSEEQTRSLVSVFEQLAALALNNNLNLRFCLSSRYYPHISVQKRVLLALENEREHFTDMSKYMSTELRIGNGPEDKAIREELLRRSGGIFLWIVIATSLLNKAYTQGQSMDVKARLQMPPSELGRLFQELITRDGENREATVICFQWLLYSFRPLTIPELYFAVKSTSPNSIPGRWDRRQVTMTDMVRYLLSISNGLVEVLADDNGSTRVQFIHESVSDYLRSEAGLSALSPSLQPSLPGRSHEILMRGCIQYLMAEEIGAIAQPGTTWASNGQLLDSVREQLPFFRYASWMVLRHAEEAAYLGIPGYDCLMQIMQLENTMLANSEGRAGLRRVVADMSKGEVLLQTCASRDFPCLIWWLKHATDNLDFVNKINMSPMMIAFVWNSKLAMAELLRPQAEWKAMANPKDLVHGSYNFAALQPLIGFPNAGYSFTDQVVGHSTLLSWYTSCGNVEMVRVLIATERVDLNARHASGRRPIMWAIQNGSEEIVQALLATGKVDLSQVYLGQNVLMLAIEYGQLNIARLLLATGQIEINATDYQGRTALFYTAGPEGTWEITKWLLSIPGVQANALDLFGTTPFFQAVVNGNTRSVAAFLDTDEVDVNHKNSTGETALMVAAISSNAPENASAEMIALLLQSPRIDANAKDARGRTLLSLAVEHKLADLVELLLKNERIDVNSQDAVGQTALHVAMLAGDCPEIVQLLMDADTIDLQLRDCWGRTAQDPASGSEDDE